MSFTVMTWNVENFFAPRHGNEPAYEAKLAALADVIIAAAPDVVAVQEIGDEASFDALRVQLGAGWSGCLVDSFRDRAPDPGRLAVARPAR